MLYCINNLKKGYNTAENKAPADVYEISKHIGMKGIVFYEPKKYNNKLITRALASVNSVKNWIRLYKRVKEKDVVLVQHPYEGARIANWFVNLCKKRKSIVFIGLIHDLGSIRGTISKEQNIKTKKRYRILDDVLLRNFDYVITHNDKMQKYLLHRGFDKNKMTTLEIFDYLHNCKLKNNRKKNKSIIIAGNLSPDKCGYLYNLMKKDQLPFNLELYGPNYQDSFQSNQIHYNGVCSPDEVPGVIDGSFGLVWDGNCIDKCAGNTGEYIMYNNPHKCSLFLASNIPVIIWEKAALADFVQKNGVGITVKSLTEIGDRIDELSNDEYLSILKNTIELGKRLRRGYYLKKAVEKLIQNNETKSIE